jgi:hypothetical protein
MEEDEWAEVPKEMFIRAEQQAGFRNTMGRPGEPATGGFTSGVLEGKVRYE